MLRSNTGALLVALAATASVGSALLSESLLQGLARPYEPVYNAGCYSTGYDCTMLHQARKKNQRGKIQRRYRHLRSR
jgi:hypothetical protein